MFRYFKHLIQTLSAVKRIKIKPANKKSSQKIGKRAIWIEGMTNRTTDNRWFQLMLSKTKIIPLLKVKPDTPFYSTVIYTQKLIRTSSHVNIVRFSFCSFLRKKCVNWINFRVMFSLKRPLLETVIYAVEQIHV